ncbi:MAG: hypothetical protein OXJ52_09375 [Oligoflexia bacterium]|nr:hypothetical protein [Oligoflexia bacterium]
MNLLFLFILSTSFNFSTADNNKKTVSIPAPLAVISSRDNTGFKTGYGVTFAPVIQLNRLALPANLGGLNCRSPHRSFNTYKVVDILSKNRPLRIIQSFPIEGALSRLLRKTGVFRYPLRTYFSFGRTGPIPFNIVQNQRGVKTAIHTLITTYPKDTLKEESLKADKTLESFKKKGQRKQKILLIFESPREKHKRCGFYGFGPSANIPKEFFNTVRKMAKETKGFHSFEAIQDHEKSMSLTVDEKSLAYLIFRSQDLNIKDIFLQ